jgi:hypothetical protein
MKKRNGSVLITTIVVVLFFSIICVAVLGLAQMNVVHYSFFERRGIVEQATLTFAESMAKSVRANSADWWPAGSGEQGNGEYVISGEMTGGSPIRFTYAVSPDESDVYKLFVKGEREDSDEKIALGVSVDIDANSSSADVWSKVVRIQ